MSAEQGLNPKVANEMCFNILDKPQGFGYGSFQLVGPLISEEKLDMLPDGVMGVFPDNGADIAVLLRVDQKQMLPLLDTLLYSNFPHGTTDHDAHIELKNDIHADDDSIWESSAVRDVAIRNNYPLAIVSFGRFDENYPEGQFVIINHPLTIPNAVALRKVKQAARAIIAEIAANN